MSTDNEGRGQRGRRRKDKENVSPTKNIFLFFCYTHSKGGIMIFHRNDDGLCILSSAPKTVVAELEFTRAKLIHTWQCLEGQSWEDGWEVLYLDTGKGEPIVLTEYPEDLQLTPSEKKRMRRCIDIFAMPKAAEVMESIKDKSTAKNYLKYFNDNHIMEYLDIPPGHWTDAC